MRWWRWLLVVVGCAIVIMVALRFLGPTIGERVAQRGQTKQADCQSNANPVFTAGFTDLEAIRSVAPIGGVTVGSPARSYIQVEGDTADTRSLAPVYAPTDATVEGIVYARRNPDDPTAPGEYRLDLRVSCEVTIHFDHLDDVVASLKSLTPSEPADNTREAVRVDVPVRAGDVLGHSNGTTQAGTWDFYLLNTAVTVPHVNPARWQWEQTTIADCPYDYFTEELKDQYYAAFRSQDGQPLESPDCGSPSHDVAGTASGGWFQGESTNASGRWLEIGNVNGKVELVVRNAGTHELSIRDYDTTTMPENLTIGQDACYTDRSNWAFVRLDTDTQLSLASGTGSCPTDFPAAQAEAWVR
ncbi:hypothetical protein HY374_02875 [Candidatus Berkelbacteria bacterium]|nr:hypothetical protein [Candidatus Berkelbacteria bacterium]